MWAAAPTPEGGVAPSLVGLAFGPDGTWYTTDYMTAELLAFSTAGELIGRAPVYEGERPEKAYGGGVVYAPGVGLVVAWGTDADVQTGALSVVDPATLTARVVRPLSAGLQRPLGVAVVGGAPAP